MNSVFPNEVYQECDNRFKRWVRVLSVHNGAVIITQCDERGVRKHSNRQTIAKQERFSGKSGGYRYCFSVSDADEHRT